jgi:NAD(P)-dependent dehydrogenase (short-subunit alcohol dehydrogenase family)
VAGQRALVTGGSRGIGAAVISRLAAAGVTMAVHCRADTLGQAFTIPAPSAPKSSTPTAIR